MASASVTWRWDRKYRGASLYLDDLRRIETLFDTASARRWTLTASDGSGVATLTADSLDDLVQARHGIASSDEISFSVGNRYGESYLWASLKTIPREWMEPRPAWEVEIGAFGASNQQAFERARRGIEEVFSRSTMTTWSQRHSRLVPAFNALLAVVWVLMVAALLARTFRWQGFDSSIVTGLVISVPWLFGLLWLASRKISQLNDWSPTLYELGYERVNAGAIRPPSFMARDIVIFLVGIVFTIGLAVVSFLAA